VVQRSLQLGEPVIYVNFNYRLNAFGWLSGKEALVGGAANVGLYDRESHSISESQIAWPATIGFIGLSPER
jgi:hypothetical protein